jgi:hypothetical protein
MVTNNGGFKGGDIVVSGGQGLREVVVEGIVDVGRYDVVYAVREVRAPLATGPVTTHLVTPLSYFRPTFARYLVGAVLACLPCCFRSSMEFEEESRAGDGSEELEMTQTDISLGSHSELSESRFSDSLFEHGQV